MWRAPRPRNYSCSYLQVLVEADVSNPIRHSCGPNQHNNTRPRFSPRMRPTDASINSTEGQRQRRARTSRPPPPPTTEQPQACSISRRFMAAPLQRRSPSCRCLVLAASTLPPECQPEAKTSTHLTSASASHHGAAASLLDQSALHGGSVAQANWRTPSCRCLVLAAGTLQPEC